MSSERMTMTAPLSSRLFTRTTDQTREYALPPQILPITITHRSIETQTFLESNKSVPSFAETQLLSVYYPEKNPSTSSNTDTCIFLEQQDRHPIRFRTSYDPLALEKSTQTAMDDSASTSSNSSVNTVIAREDRLLGERTSSWPPVPDEALIEVKRPSRVQFADQLINIIPPSQTNSLTDPSTSPVAQSKWVKDRLDGSEVRTHSPSRVSALRSKFEQSSDSSSPSSPIQQRSKSDPEEKPSPYGDQIRFRIQTSNHMTEKIQVTETTTTVSNAVAEPLTWEALLGLQPDPSKRFVTTMTIPRNAPSVPPPPVPKRSESQLTISESGYQSGDDQNQRLYQFRPQNKPKPIIEEPSTSPVEVDPLSYEAFINDYFATHARHLCASDGTLVVLVDEQQVPFTDIRIPAQQQHLSLPKNIYSNGINSFPRPFQTELNQLVIFINGESVVLPESRWKDYQKKYQQATWVEQLPRINREIPFQLISNIEEWLSGHTQISPKTKELIIDGVSVPLIGRYGQSLLNFSETSSAPSNYWHELLNYLLRLGYVSFQSSKKIISIVHSELDVRLLLSTPSTDSIEQLILYLQSLDDLRFHPNNGSLILNENFVIPKEYAEYLIKPGEKNVDYYELARLLLRLCDVIENSTDQTILLTFDGQTLRLIDQRRLLREKLIDCLQMSQSEWIDGEQQHRLKMFFGQQMIQFDEHDSKMLVDDLHGLIQHCAEYLINQAFDRIQYEPKQPALIIIYHLQNVQLPISSRDQTRPQRTKLLIIEKRIFDSRQREAILSWLQQCQDRRSLVISDTNDILIGSMVIHHDDVEHYMSTRNTTIALTDIAEILHRYHYIQSSTDQIQIGQQIIPLARVEVEKIQTKIIEEPSVTKFDNERFKLIDRFVEFINDHDGIYYNNKTHRLILENTLNQSQLVLNEDDSQWIKENQYRRQDVKDLLFRRCQLEQDEFQNWLLFYDDQCIQLAPQTSDKNPTTTTTTKITDPDANLQLLFPFNPSLRLIQKTASTSTLDIPLSNRTNKITVDPLLMLANYIYRAATIYQDDLGRLVIKMQEHEVVVPQQDASSAIESINTAPQRTGTVIAKLIARIGQVQSNGRGGLIITIRNSSFEIPKENIDASMKVIQPRPRKSVTTTPLPLLRQSQSASNLLSSPSDTSLFSQDRQTLYSKDGRGDPRYLNLDYRSYQTNNPQRSVSIDDLTRSDSYTVLNQQQSTSSFLKPQLIIVPSDFSSNEQNRFYVRYIYEKDAAAIDPDSTGLMMIPSRYPIQPTQPQLIAPDHHRDQALRDASVFIHQANGEKLFFENLAQYLATDQTVLSSWNVRRMLRFNSNTEYFNYLVKAMSPDLAEHLVRTSQSSTTNRSAENLSSTAGAYNVQVAQTRHRDRSPSSSSLDSDMIIVNKLAARPKTVQNNFNRSVYRNRIENES